MSRSLASLVLVSLVAGVAHAGDGRLEISQACVAAGCFAGDAPGFPVQAQQGRSYVLTSDLVVPDAATLAVSLGPASTLDLNGFAITGPTVCSGAPATCTGTGVGDGVYAQARAAVRNGAIRGMGSHGVAAEVGVAIENVLVEGNGGDGLHLNFGSDGPEAHLVRGCRIAKNGGNGIQDSGGGGGIGTLITDNVIHGNGGYGASAFHVHFTNNAVTRNGDEGLYAGSPTAVGGNTFSLNNGGNGNAQTVGTLIQIAPNLCGVDAVCP